MNEVVVGLFMVAVVVMIGFNKFTDYKKTKAYEAAQKVIKEQIKALEDKLAALKK